MIDDKSEPGAWQREIDQRPQCAHKTVRHAPEFIPPTGTGPFGEHGTWRDRWQCAGCGLTFIPGTEAVQQAITASKSLEGLRAENERLREWKEFVEWNTKDAAAQADEAMARRALESSDD